MIVIPSDFEIDESNNALVSFVREAYSDRNNKRISRNLKVQVGQWILSKFILDGMNWFALLQKTFLQRQQYK
jgi:hypothetical protein